MGGDHRAPAKHSWHWPAHSNVAGRLYFEFHALLLSRASGSLCWPGTDATTVRNQRAKTPCIGHSGNARLRTALYLATLSAARYNPVIKRFYDRLRAQGKPAKVARCAAARKLVHLAFAVATNEEDFDPHYHPKSEQQAARAQVEQGPALSGKRARTCHELTDLPI